MSTGVTINSQFVREVITTLLPDSEIEGSISSAIVLYDQYLLNKSIGDDTELEIKRYLAAHFVSLRDPSTRVDKEKIGDVSIEYSKIGQDESFGGLMSTRWGQMAISFDPTKILKGIIGTPPKMYAL